MGRYKADQGVYARNAAFALLAALWLRGCYAMYYWLLSFRGDAETPGGMATDLTGGPVPVLGLAITPAFIVAIVVSVAGLVGLRRLVDSPKAADMLIESETEMRKCTWPTWPETFNSSLVILVVMAFFTFFLAGSDMILNTFMRGVVF